jgi:hypothetical protein
MKGTIGAEKEHEYALGWFAPLPDFLRKRASCVGVQTTSEPFGGGERLVLLVELLQLVAAIDLGDECARVVPDDEQVRVCNACADGARLGAGLLIEHWYDLAETEI